MSRRTNGTNRTGAMINASRYTGYGKPKKKTASLAELNGRINKNINRLIISRDSGGCNGKSICGFPYIASGSYGSDMGGSIQ